MFHLMDYGSSGQQVDADPDDDSKAAVAAVAQSPGADVQANHCSLG